MEFETPIPIGTRYLSVAIVYKASIQTVSSFEYWLTFPWVRVHCRARYVWLSEVFQSSIIKPISVQQKGYSMWAGEIFGTSWKANVAKSFFSVGSWRPVRAHGRDWFSNGWFNNSAGSQPVYMSHVPHGNWPYWQGCRCHPTRSKITDK